jgi:acetyl-CoA C-acetyltransferase
MADVAIVGAGQSVFSRDCGVSIRELAFDAFKEALEGLDITTGDIDASIICSAPEYDKQRSPAALYRSILS